MTTTAPLAGVKVLDLTRLYPGAFATLLLADLGADVVKVEAPRSGDGMRALAPPGAPNPAHLALNRGKRSVELDLRAAEAAPVLRRLAAWAEVLVESHPPGKLDELGLGFDALRAENPALVWCSITGFGTTGPLAAAPGHDLTFLGASGLLAALGAEPPVPPDLAVSLPLAGSLAASGILAALLDASRTGVGRRVEVAMTEAAAWMLSEDVARAANAPGPPWGELAGRRVYECADGHHVTVAATEPRTWAALCGALGLDDLAGHRLGVDDEAPVIERVAAALRTRPAADWEAEPGLAGGIGPVRTAAELLDDPQLLARDGFLQLDGSGATVLASPIRLDGAGGAASSRARQDPPALGADTASVLAELGIAEDGGASGATEGGDRGDGGT